MGETVFHEGSVSNGKTFRFPDTMSCAAALTTTASLIRPGTIIWVGLPAIMIALALFLIQGQTSIWFFVFQHVAWRLAYNAGIGYILYSQSNSKKFQMFYSRVIKKQWVKWFLESSVIFSDHSEFRIKDYPEEFNAWMLFRQIENIILANDLVSYLILFGVCLVKNKDEVLQLAAIPNIVLGVLSALFAMWSKVDAHRVLSEFAWYWGDFFFLVKKEVAFDGIFQMFPHPMYTVGYAFIYGLPLMTNSFIVFWVGVFAHVCQILFLMFVEEPHIQKVYSSLSAPAELKEQEKRDLILYGKSKKDPAYFDVDESVFLFNIKRSRNKDIPLVFSLCIHIFLCLFAPLSVSFFVGEFLMWVILLYGGLSYILHRQGQSKWFTKKFSSPQKAFTVWKSLYNLCATMMYISFFTCAALLYTTEGFFAKAVRSHVFFVDLVWLMFSINVYYYASCFYTTGKFGFYFSDFFIDDIKTKLTYDGIYRYFSYPQIFVGVGFYYGCGILSGNIVVVLLAVAAHLALTVSTYLVEKPHLYVIDKNARSEGGLKSEIRNRIRQVTSEKKNR